MNFVGYLVILNIVHIFVFFCELSANYSTHQVTLLCQTLLDISWEQINVKTDIIQTLIILFNEGAPYV